MKPGFDGMKPSKGWMTMIRRLRNNQQPQQRPAGDSALRELERLFRFPQAKRHREVLSVVKDHDMFAFEHWQEFLDLVEVYDR